MNYVIKKMIRELGQVTLLKGHMLIRSKGEIVHLELLVLLFGMPIDVNGNTMLPEKLKTCKSLDDFKISIKSWRPENCTCELCKNYIRGLGYVVISE